MVGSARGERRFMSEARQEILGAIRAATKTSPSRSGFERGGRQIPRAYRTAGGLSAPERLGLFVERLHDYDADTHLCAPVDLAKTIGQCLERAGLSRIILPLDFPEDWLPPNQRFLRDENLSYERIDRSDGVITACTVAIALTGTIVLREGGFAQGRRALTLIPDYHLCVVEEAQIVETVPEAISKIEPYGTHAITTISGPSATADIEMIRVRGVHGPRVLEVILTCGEESYNSALI